MAPNPQLAQIAAQRVRGNGPRPRVPRQTPRVPRQGSRGVLTPVGRRRQTPIPKGTVRNTARGPAYRQAQQGGSTGPLVATGTLTRV